MARSTLTMVMAGATNRGKYANDNHPAVRWAAADSQGDGGETTSAAEMLQSLQPVRDLAQNFDIDIAT
jgi:hypothetical protein